MLWQDIIITIASIVFSIALIPQVYHGFKNKVGLIKLATSIPTFLGLYAISFTYWTLELPFSTVISFITGTIRLILCVQRMIYEKK